MTSTRKTLVDASLSDLNDYLNRELNWLELNQRILRRVQDSQIPLVERLKFTALLSANFDEFFMARVATLMQAINAQFNQSRSTITLARSSLARSSLEAIRCRLRGILAEQHHHFEKTLRPQLEAHGIHLLSHRDLNPVQQHYLQHQFEQRIFPLLTPLAVDPGRPFPFIPNLSLNLAILLNDPITQKELFATLKLPDTQPRLMRLPPHLQPKSRQPHLWTGVLLEQVVAHHLDRLFPGMTIQECALFRITRDVDRELDGYTKDNVVLAIQQEVRQRRLGGLVVRMEISASASALVRKRLMHELGLTKADVYDVDGILNLKDCLSLVSQSYLAQ